MAQCTVLFPGHRDQWELPLAHGWKYHAGAGRSSGCKQGLRGLGGAGAAGRLSRQHCSPRAEEAAWSHPSSFPGQQHPPPPAPPMQPHKSLQRKAPEPGFPVTEPHLLHHPPAPEESLTVSSSCSRDPWTAPQPLTLRGHPTISAAKASPWGEAAPGLRPDLFRELQRSLRLAGHHAAPSRRTPRSAERQDPPHRAMPARDGPAPASAQHHAEHKPAGSCTYTLSTRQDAPLKPAKVKPTLTRVRGPRLQGFGLCKPCVTQSLPAQGYPPRRGEHQVPISNKPLP